MTLDLDDILAKARAAAEEAGSGAWTEAEERWTRGHVQNKPGQITIRDDSPRVIASPNPNFPGAAIAAHIASAGPDVVIALVERLQAAETMLAAVTAGHDAAKAHALDVERDRDERLAALVRGEQHERKRVRDLVQRLVEVERERDGQSELVETYLASWFEAIDLATARDAALDACQQRIAALTDHDAVRGSLRRTINEVP